VNHLDKNKFKLSIILFLVTFSLIIYFEKNHNIIPQEISTIKLSQINNFVKVEGFVKSQNLYNNNLFVDFCSDLIFMEKDCIKLILFETDKKLELNFKYKVLGKITYYNNKLEIIVREIKVK